MELLVTIAVFLIILSVLVLIHEAGHFFVAKKFGIKVEEFGFGFPPRAFGIKRGETIYSINWLPIGGFVKLYGEDEAGGGKVSKTHEHITKNLDRAFFARPVWQRASVVVAGVVMNAILACGIFYLFLGISNFKTEVPLLGNFSFFGVTQQNVSEVVVSSVSKNSPAYNAGMKAPSRILTLNGKPIVNAATFADEVSSKKGEPVVLEWEEVENKTLHKATIVPRLNPPKNEGALGVGFFALSLAKLSYDTPAQKIFSGITYPVNLMQYNLVVMGDLIAASFEKKSVEPVSQGFSGPVGIGSLVGSILSIENVKEKLLQLLNLAGILSISLAFFNILPIPALDGGRLFFILIEGVTRRKVNQRVESLIHTVGMAVLLTLILLITFKDIGQLFQ